MTIRICSCVLVIPLVLTVSFIKRKIHGHMNCYTCQKISFADSFIYASTGQIFLFLQLVNQKIYCPNIIQNTAKIMSNNVGPCWFKLIIFISTTFSLRKYNGYKLFLYHKKLHSSNISFVRMMPTNQSHVISA